MRLRVLFSAYACEPHRGSEPGVGWNWTRQISSLHQVWVITRANNRTAIEAALGREPMPNAHFVYFDLPGWARFWKKGTRGVRLYYYLWQIGAYFIARKLCREVKFDLVHHVTLVKYWAPSFLVRLPAPFVWGPVGGGESAPPAFWRSFSLRGKVYETARDLARRLGELDPFVRRTARRAALAFATTEATAARLRALGCRSVRVYPDAGLSDEDMRRLGSLAPHDAPPFRFLSIGNLLHLKGFEFSLRAFAMFHRAHPSSEYWLVGDGPERRRLARMAAELKLGECFKLWGQVPRSEVLDKLAECDVLVHPTLHDSGGWVCLEAMAAGRPVLCLDLGGPAVQVTPETGIKVPALQPEQVVTGLFKAMELVADDPLRRARLGAAGRQRVAQDYRWSRKCRFLSAIYEELAGHAAESHRRAGPERRAAADAAQPSNHHD